MHIIAPFSALKESLGYFEWREFTPAMSHAGEESWETN
jgi:hypothetical protein